MSVKRLTIDIETAPAIAEVWGLFDQNVGLSQLKIPSRVICWAAKWYGNSKVEFRSEYHDGRDEMIARAHTLLDEADVLIHYNGIRFDKPHLYREFLLAGMKPPSPTLQVDLYRTARREFKFMSNKLEHISTQVGLAGKLKHTGHELWTQCLDPAVDAGVKAKAWALMRRYNIQDVRLTEQLYDELTGWISGHPNLGLFSEEVVCPNCGSASLRKEGHAPTQLALRQRFQCKDCGKWSASGKTLKRVDLRGVQ